MSAPRNKVAWERGQRARAIIRAHLDEHVRLHRYARRPTWRQLQMHLRAHGIYLERSTICYHVQQIELELDRSLSDSSTPEQAA